MTVRRREAYWLAIGTLSGLLMLPGSLSAQDDAMERSTLSGLAAVLVAAGVGEGNTSLSSYAEDRLARDVQLHLRNGEIPVLESGERPPPEAGVLAVTLDVLEAPALDGAVFYSIRIEAIQVVRLARDPTQRAAAPTWNVRSLGYAGSVQRLEEGLPELIKEQVDRFVRAYWSVNARR